MLVVETGDLTSPTANTYVDLDYVDTYFEERDAPEIWFCQTDDKREAAIRYASLYLETKYKFKGCLQEGSQPLSFPRTSFYDEEGRLRCGEGVIPLEVKQAVSELALRHCKEDLFKDLNSQEARILSEKVGDRSVNLKSSQTNNNFKVVTRLLEPYIKSSTNVLRIYRG